MIDNVVLDTNVIISSTFSSKGNPSKIMTMFYEGNLNIIYTEEIFEEYVRVLGYERLNIAEDIQTDMILALDVGGTLIDEPEASTITFTDESDRKFYDAAKSCNAILITGNTKHYPSEPFVLTPADFISKYANH